MAEGLEIQFDVVSYTLIALLAALIVLPVVFAKDPDIHPYALLRQSSVAPVRNPKESAVYRSVQTPHGYPLVSGLQLPGDKTYTSRAGDIRDIWKLAIEKGKGKLLSVKGVSVEEHDFATLTKQMHALGSHLRSIGAKRVAIHLSNDVENLVASFACAFYGIVLIIIPFDPSGTPRVEPLLQRASPDVLIAEAGQLAIDNFQHCGLKEVILVVEKASEHLDWTSPVGGIKSVQYSDIIAKNFEPIEGIDVDLDAPAVVIFGPEISGEIDMVEFSHRNIIAGVASQTAVLPKAERYNIEDVFLPVDSLSDLYTRVHTYVALSSGSTVALNSIGGKHADVQKACKIVKPSIIVVAPESLFEIHSVSTGSMMQIWHGLIHYFQTRTLTVHGQIPRGNLFTRVNDYIRPDVGPNIRLIFVAESAGDPNAQPLNSLDLSDLRVFFKSKVVYGLKHHKVAGPVTQYNIYDYRVQPPKQLPSVNKRIPRKCAHFGPVTPGLEIKLRDVAGYSVTDPEGPRGEVIVAGAPVAGNGQTSLEIAGKWEPEGVLSYAA